MHWEDVLDTALFTSLINTCRSTVEKCSVKADNPKNSKEFDGRLSLGDTYLLFHNSRERKVLQKIHTQVGILVCLSGNLLPWNDLAEKERNLAREKFPT